MVSSDDEDNFLNNSNYTLSSSSPSTSSFASSPLTSPASTLTLSGPTHFNSSSTTTSQETMEGVWEDINLSSLHDHSSSPTFRGVILQDFFARPFSKSPSTSLPPDQYGSPPPATRPVSLNLNTHPNNNVPFLGLVSSDDPNNRAPSICNAGLHRMPPFDHFLPSSPSSWLPNNGLIRRFPENERSSGGGDRRHKRMIKNRESAARSRARKQAYTNELESEIERLKEELARQKQQLQQSMRSSQAAAAAAGGGKFPRKCSLRRTCSAPL